MTSEEDERKRKNCERTRAYRARKSAENPDWNAAYAEKKARQSQRRKYWLGKYKMHHGCDICGWSGHHAALDFDHVDPQDKSFHIAQSIAGRALSPLMAEVRKCRGLCANCHRIHTYNEAQRNKKYE